MSTVFLSHIEKDLPVMQEIACGLEEAGYSTWYFERDVIAGTSYLIQITRALENCEAMSLILLGCIENAINPAVINEAERRIRSGIAILEELRLNALIAAGYLYLGEFLAGAGRHAEALESLKMAEKLYHEMEVAPQSFWLMRARDAVKGLERG